MNISPIDSPTTPYAIKEDTSLFQLLSITDTLTFRESLTNLLNLGANINETEPKDNLNLLQKCIIEDCPFLFVNALLDNGIDVNHQDVDGITALHFAICEEHYFIAETLLDYGANPAIVDKRGETAHHDLENLVNADPERAEQRKEMLELLKTSPRPLTCKETVKYIIDHQMTYANMSAFQDFDDADLKNLSDNCPLIKTLILRSTKFTESSLGDALEKFKNLECLDISWCLQLTGKEFKGCPNLKKLSICGCWKVNGNALEQMIGKLPKLESLNIDKWVKISEDDLQKHPLVRMIS